MKTKMVSYRREDIPPLTDEAIARLKALSDCPDSEIDLTDIPEWTAEDFRNVVRGRYYRPVKAQVTTKLDADVIAWLKKDGKGYQTRMNAILRKAMLEATHEERKAG